VRRLTRRASWHAPLAARTADAPRTRGLSHSANDRCKRRVASFRAVEGRLPKLPSRPPIRDQMGPGTCLYAWLGPRLVHTPSEPSGSQRSPAVGRSRRLQARSWGNGPWGRTLIRMRSQVQVLAGPPLIPAGHSAAGSEPRTPAAGLGRAGAAPHPRPGGHPDRPAPRPPLTVVATQPEDDSHAAAAASSRRGLLLRPRRSRQPRTLHTPAWPAWSLSGHARPPPPTPPGPGPPPTPRLTNARPRRQPTGTFALRW
jgi:hypothetical protein